MNEVMLRLVAGEDVHYRFCNEFTKDESVLDEIKYGKSYIKVTDEKGRRLTIFPNKVVGCYIKRG